LDLIRTGIEATGMTKCFGAECVTYPSVATAIGHQMEYLQWTDSHSCQCTRVSKFDLCQSKHPRRRYI